MNVASLISPLTLPALGTALACGLIIGLERQLFHKPIGIRTSILICTGAYVFIVAGKFAAPDGSALRILAQIITGIGFIGGGVIMSRGESIIGVTSAAVIWILAGVGILIGLGRYGAAVMLSVLTVGILLGVTQLERVFRHIDYGFKRKHQPKEDDSI